MRDKLKQALEKIGWSIKGRYPLERIYTHENKSTDVIVMGDRVEISGNNYSCCFHFTDVELYELENKDGVIDCVGLKAKNNEGVFIQFYNHLIK